MIPVTFYFDNSEIATWWTIRNLIKQANKFGADKCFMIVDNN